VNGRLDFWLESRLPNLAAAGYQVTSPKDKSYNCVAWAVEGNCNRWWEPSNGPGHFWPKSLPMTYNFANYVGVFELAGYTLCSDASFVKGFEKVAIFQDVSGEFTHVAKQLATGSWTSKLGKCEDIEHMTVDVLISTDYGKPAVYLHRKITIWRKLKKLRISLLSRLKS